MCTGTLIVKFVDWAFSPMLCRHCCKKFPNISATTTRPIPRRKNQKAVDPHDIRNRTYLLRYHMYRKNQVPHVHDEVTPPPTADSPPLPRPVCRCSPAGSFEAPPLLTLTVACPPIFVVNPLSFFSSVPPPE
jgi:hypothetical protein